MGSSFREELQSRLSAQARAAIDGDHHEGENKLILLRVL
jgi:hypothetical protein